MNEQREIEEHIREANEEQRRIREVNRAKRRLEELRARREHQWAQKYDANRNIVKRQVRFCTV